MKDKELNERELPDDYPVYPTFLYVADNKVIQTFIEGTIKDLKKEGNYKVITNCDIFGRNLQDKVFGLTKS